MIFVNSLNESDHFLAYLPLCFLSHPGEMFASRYKKIKTSGYQKEPESLIYDHADMIIKISCCI